MCKEAGLLLRAVPSFSVKLPEIAEIGDDGDRWLVGIYKIAKMGKVQAQLKSANCGTDINSEAGEIKDLPGASRTLCHMAMNDFRRQVPCTRHFRIE
jgi:hypothetical protein